MNKNNDAKILLELKGIYKIYPNGTVANKGIDLEIYKDEIHAIVGENGAGKSTLMKILFGLESATSGKIIFKGKEVNIKNPKDAIALGLGMVHQEFMLVPSFSIAENISLGNEMRRGLFLDRKKERIVIFQISKKFGLSINPDERVYQVSVGIKQRIEIMKVLYQGATILILDEPTSVLTPLEVDELFNSLRILVNKGYSIIFITHKIREVMRVSDRVTILRDGRKIKTLITKETNQEEISNLIVGKKVKNRVERKPIQLKDTILEVKNLSSVNDRGFLAVNNISFSIRAGEVFGIAGVEGNGQTELIECITGLRKPFQGEINILGKNFLFLNTKKFRDLSIGFIPEDRYSLGASINSTLEENLILNTYQSKLISRGPFIRSSAVKEFTKQLINDFDIKADDGRIPMKSLSGGNIQKSILAREFFQKPKLLIASQPTRGLDINSTQYVHERIIEQRDAGVATLLVSAELSEIMKICDRIGVIYNGKIDVIFKNKGNLSEKKIGYFMLGLHRKEEKNAKSSHQSKK